MQKKKAKVIDDGFIRAIKCPECGGNSLDKELHVKWYFDENEDEEENELSTTPPMLDITLFCHDCEHYFRMRQQGDARLMGTVHKLRNALGLSECVQNTRGSLKKQSSKQEVHEKSSQLRNQMQNSEVSGMTS